MKKILVSIILLYLRLAANIQLAKINPVIIGVAGSSGKSSLVSLIGGMLSEKYTVKQSQGKNSETGLPLDILNIHMKDFSAFSWLGALLLAPIQLFINWKKYDYYVAEMGIDSPVEPKNMSYLLKIIHPTIAVVTNISLEHSVYFEPYIDEIDPVQKQEKILEATAEQEILPLTSLTTQETGIVNLDDAYIQKVQKEIVAKQITIAVQTKADLIGKDITTTLSRFSMIIAYQEKNYPLSIEQALPSHFAYEFLLAIAVGLTCNMSIEDAIIALKKHFSLPPGRMSLFKGINNSLLIDSTYNNATLPPIIDMLDFMKEISGKRRKVTILGDMRELGEESQDMHEAVAQKLLETVDFVVLIGPMSEQYMVPILRSAHIAFENFPDVTSAKKAIQQLIQPDDIILVKGSQNMLFLERIVEMLLADKKDVEKLTRRGEFWDKKREETA